MNVYVREVMHDGVKALVRCWLGGEVISDSEVAPGRVAFFVTERDLGWWLPAADGKRVKVTFELEDEA